MPLVHFGDTSYEKYIFGGQGKLSQDNKKTAVSSDNQATDDTGDSEVKKDRWEALDKAREDAASSSKEICTTKDSYMNENSEKGDYNSKYRGTHKTTVNFLKDENSVVPKVSEGMRVIFSAYHLHNNSTVST